MEFSFLLVLGLSIEMPRESCKPSVGPGGIGGAVNKSFERFQILLAVR
jgi:hypothetical protein